MCNGRSLVKTKLILLSLLVALASAVSAQEVCREGPRPAALDDGPVAQIRNLRGPDFDIAYMRVMYQLHSDIRALSSLEYQRTNDRTLMDLSQHISGEQSDLIAKLSIWYKQRTGGDLSSFCVQSSRDYSALQTTPNLQFDNGYAETMIGLLQHELDASKLATTTATMPELRDQSKIVERAAGKEIKAMQNWQNDLPVQG